MFKLSLLKTLIPILLLASVLYISYHFYLKEIYWNNQTRTIQIEDLSQPKQFYLKKHTAQGNISSLEIEIKGASDKTIYFSYSQKNTGATSQIMIKKGKINYVEVSDWYDDNSIFTISSEEDALVNLSIDYRFIGNN